jgi:hypothetical protein
MYAGQQWVCEEILRNDHVKREEYGICEDASIVSEMWAAGARCRFRSGGVTVTPRLSSAQLWVFPQQLKPNLLLFSTVRPAADAPSLPFAPSSSPDMANYLPVLLVSVTNAVPDDSFVTTQPQAQVDYLSHDWQEEDVWKSWRNMTRQKNEIANGIRLENASWRTWWKQRNKLKTVTPETLNWCVPDRVHPTPISPDSFPG